MLNRQLPTSFLVKAIAPAGKRAMDLAPFELGLIDKDSNLTVSAATYAPDKSYQFVLGSPSTGADNAQFGDIRGAAMPLRSLPITRIDKVHVFDEATAEAKPFVAYLGYDGINDCKNLSFECGSTYGLMVQVRGKNVRDVFGRNLMEIIPFHTDCCEGCTLTEASSATADKIMEAIKKDSFYVNQFFKAELVKECCPAEAPFDKVDYTVYRLKVCDMGDINALADVKIAYPGYDISRVSRDGAYSTYEMCIPAADAAPADFEQVDNVLVNCDTCPDDYTLVPSSQVYLVTLAYDGNDDPLTHIQTVLPTATAATLMKVNGTQATFQVSLPAAYVEAPIDDVQLVKVGDSSPYCTQDTPSSTSWVEAGDKYKIARTVTLTLKNVDCDGSDRLADLIATYAGKHDIVAGSIAIKEAGDCLTVYEMDQLNNACLEDGCDVFGKDGAVWNPIPAFEGFVWTTDPCEGWTVDGDGCPVPPANVTDTCNVGIKFTGAFLDRKTNRCSFAIDNQVFVDPVEIEVTIIDQHTEPCTPLQVDWTVVQYPTIAQGLGEFVARELVKSRGYEGYIYSNPNSEMGVVWREALGYEYGFEPEKLYNHISLYHNSDRNRYAYKSDSSNRELIKLYVEATNGTLMDSLKTFLNATLVGQGLAKLAV